MFASFASKLLKKDKLPKPSGFSLLVKGKAPRADCDILYIISLS